MTARCFARVMFAVLWLGVLLQPASATHPFFIQGNPPLETATDGTASERFTHLANGRISGAVALPDGRIAIHGRFTQYDGQPRSGLAITFEDGSLDESFVPDLWTSNNNITSVIPLEDGRIVAAGWLAHNVEGAWIQTGLAVFNPDGTPNMDFQTQAVNGPVNAMIQDMEQRLIIGGTFSLIDGQSIGRIARLNHDGAVDPDFNVQIPSGRAVYALALVEDRVYIGGDFTSISDYDIAYLARLHPHGEVEEEFNAYLNAQVEAITGIPGHGHQVYVGGLFTTVADQPRRYIARLHDHGQLDEEFQVGEGFIGQSMVDRVYALLAYEDQSVIVGGHFFEYNGITRNGVAKLYADGSLDDHYDPDMRTAQGIGGGVISINDAGEGRVFVGGDFTTVSGHPQFAGLVRLTPDGSVDAGGPGGGDPTPFVSEDFEDGFPSDWAVFGNEFGMGANSTWSAFEAGGMGSVARSAWNSSAPGGSYSEDYMATPFIEVLSDQVTTLHFDAGRGIFSAFGSTLHILVAEATGRSIPTDISAYTEIAVFDELEIDMAIEGGGAYHVDLTAYAGTNVHVAFMHRQNNGNVFFVDNVEVVYTDPVPPVDPFTFEDFEDGFPSDWAVFGNEYGMGNSTWSAFEAGGMGNVARSSWNNSAPGGSYSEDYMATPVVIVEEHTAVRFNSGRGMFSPQGSTLHILVAEATGRSIPTDISAYTEIAVFQDVDLGMAVEGGLELEISLAAYAGAHMHIAFMHRQNNGNVLFIDNVEIVEATPPSGDPIAVFTPEVDTGIEVDVNTGETVEATFTIANEGTGVLEFSIPQYTSTRVEGNSAPTRSGGPDAHGYQWIDSNDPFGPQFDNINIATTGTPVELQQNDSPFPPHQEGYADVALPFSFEFYGETYETVRIWTNGIVGFDLNYYGNTYAPQALPHTLAPNAVIAAVWADFTPNQLTETVNIFTETLEDGRFVVQWNEWPRFLQTTPNTFQIILYPNGSIKFQYLDINGQFTGNTSTGIENQTGTVGLQVYRGANHVHSGLATLISRGSLFVSEVSPAAGSLNPGEEQEITVVVDATYLYDGTYTGSFLIQTNEENGVYSYPVTVNATGTPGCTFSPAIVALGNVIIGTTTEVELSVINAGTAYCTVDSITSSSTEVTTSFGGPITLAQGESFTFDVIYTPVAEGALTAQLTLESDGKPAQAHISATALRAPVFAIDQDSFEITLEPGATATESFTISNTGSEGAADLEYDITLLSARPATSPTVYGTRDIVSVREGFTLSGNHDTSGQFSFVDYVGSPILGYRGDNTVFLTHSASQNILEEQGISCLGETGSTANSFWRVFNLADFGLLELTWLNVTSIDVGVELVEINGSASATVRLYTLNGAFTTANLTLVGEGSFNLTDTTLELVNVPLHAEVTGAETLVVELAVPDIRPQQGYFFPGGNGSGQSAPTYFSAADCSLLEPTNYADIGFPDFHWVTNIHGATRAGMLTADPFSGSIAPAGSSEITLTADAADVDEGTYQFEVLISTNDPQTPSRTIDVTILVKKDVSNDPDATPLTFDLVANYPNPFSDATTVVFELPQTEHVVIEVIDLTGRRVATLVDEQLDAARHEVTWHANGLASGVYLYRMQAGSFTKTLRTTLVR